MTRFRDYVDTDAAAERLGIHPETVRRLIRQNELPAMKRDGHWLIQRDTLDVFAQGYDGRSGPRPKEVVKDPERQTQRAKLRAKRQRALRDAIQTIVSRGPKERNHEPHPPAQTRRRGLLRRVAHLHGRNLAALQVRARVPGPRRRLPVMTANLERSELASRLARIDISPALLAVLLSMPKGMNIERLYVRNDDPARNTPNLLSIVVSSPEFPELLWGDRIPELSVWLSMEDGRFVFHWHMPGQAEPGEEATS